MHTAPDVQDIFDTLTVADVDAHNDEYTVTLEALDQYFQPKVNVPYERHLFRQLRQESHESVSQFATRLSKQAEYCDFAERKEEYIRDQIIENCKSVATRKAFLEKHDLSLTQLLDIARAKEAAEQQTNVMEANPPILTGIKTSICAVTKNSDKTVRSTPVVKCTRCGRKDHCARDSQCPARDKTCHKCAKTGHFAAQCKSKAASSRTRDAARFSQSVNKGQTTRRTFKTRHNVNTVDNSGEEYAFTIGQSAAGDNVDDVIVGGVELKRCPH